MKYIILLFFIGITFASCSSGDDGEDISPCHDLVPTEQDSNQ